MWPDWVSFLVLLATNILIPKSSPNIWWLLGCFSFKRQTVTLHKTEKVKTKNYSFHVDSDTFNEKYFCQVQVHVGGRFEAVLRPFLRLPLKIKTTTGQPKSFNFPTAKLMIRSRGSESQCDQMVFQNFIKNLIYLHRKCAQVYKIGQSRYETKNKLFKMLSATFKNYPKSTISPNLVTLVTEQKNRPMQFMSTLSRGMWTGDIRLRLCGKNELHSVLPDWAIFEKSWQQIFIQWKPKYLVPLWDISIF